MRVLSPALLLILGLAVGPMGAGCGGSDEPASSSAGGGQGQPAAAPKPAPPREEPEPETPKEVARKTLVFGRGKDSVRLDPADAADGESVAVVVNLFDTLLQYKSGTTELAPALATAWESTEDGLGWVFTLRKDVTFHDGSPMDAAAVAFSFWRQMDPKRHPEVREEIRKRWDLTPEQYHQGDFVYWNSMFQDIREVRVLGKHRVGIELRRPYSPFLNNLVVFSASIVSPTAFQKHGAGFRDHPVGTGPFVFEKWVREQTITLSRNPYYWGGAPELGRVIFKTVPDNTVRLLQLEKGDLDIIDGLNPEDLEVVEESDDLELLRAPGMNVAYLAFNTKRPPFDNGRIRRALAAAIDKEELAEGLYLGAARPARSLLPPTLWGHKGDLLDYSKITVDIPPSEEEIERAEEAEEGLEIQTTVQNRDPLWGKKVLAQMGYDEGFEVPLWTMENPRPYMPQPRKVAQYIKERFRKIGVKVTIRVWDWATYLEKLERGEHHMALLGWTADTADPDNFLYVLLDKDNARPGSASNISFYDSEAVHKKLLEAQREYSRIDRTKLYHEAQDIVHADCPVVPLVHTDQIVAMRKAVKGFVLQPTGEKRFHRVTLGE